MTKRDMAVDRDPDIGSGWLDAIPTVSERSDGPGSDLWRLGQQPTRRRVLQAFSVIGGAVALNALGMLSGTTLRRAYATVGTEHPGCGNYSTAAGYNNDTQVCVGYPYSSAYCGSDGWFKHVTTSIEDWYPIAVCGNDPSIWRNAWRWTYSGGVYRCADGNYRYKDGGGNWSYPETYICSKYLYAA